MGQIAFFLSNFLSIPIFFVFTAKSYTKKGPGQSLFHEYRYASSG